MLFGRESVLQALQRREQQLLKTGLHLFAAVHATMYVSAIDNKGLVSFTLNVGLLTVTSAACFFAGKAYQAEIAMIKARKAVPDPWDINRMAGLGKLKHQARKYDEQSQACTDGLSKVVSAPFQALYAGSTKPLEELPEKLTTVYDNAQKKIQAIDEELGDKFSFKVKLMTALYALTIVSGLSAIGLAVGGVSVLASGISLAFFVLSIVATTLLEMTDTQMQQHEAELDYEERGLGMLR